MPLTNLASDPASCGLDRLSQAMRGRKPGIGDHEEEDQGHHEEQPAEGTQDPREEVGQQVGDLAEVELAEGVARRARAEAQLGQAVLRLVGEVLGVLRVLRDQVHQLDQADDGPDQEHGQDGVRRDEGEQGASHPGHPWRRAHDSTGSTPIVSTSASIVGATMPAAPRTAAPKATAPMTPSITVTIRGSGGFPATVRRSGGPVRRAAATTCRTT